MVCWSNEKPGQKAKTQEKNLQMVCVNGEVTACIGSPFKQETI